MKRRPVRDAVFSGAIPCTSRQNRKKQSKHVAVCLDRIRAEIPLRGQVMRQEARHVNGKIGGLHR